MSLHLAFNGARPNAFMRELARQFRGRSAGFTISSSGMGGSHLGLVLLTTGIASKVICAFVGEAYPSPRPSRFIREAVQAGQLEIEEWSMLTLALRLKASALGLDWIPTRSLSGSSFQEENKTRCVSVDGHDLTLVPALTPDLTLLHGVVADPAGNTILAPPYGENISAALAARLGCLVTVERIVSAEEFRRYNALPTVPAAAVRSVSEVPFGSHPGGVFAPLVLDGYADDYDFMQEATEATRLPAAEREAWIDRWFAVEPAAYMRQLGQDRLARLKETGSGRPAAASKHPSEPTSEEHLITHAARLLADAVAADPPGLVIGGVGLASLSTWLAAHQSGSFPPLVSEVGVVGFEPQPGNPFLFSFENMRHTAAFSDLEGVLGTLVNSDRQRALGVLAAGEIDGTGAINTSWSRSGEWLTGSGGANDIASGAGSVLVTVLHRPGRLVEKVSHTTSPGRAVRWIVTDLAIFERPPDATSFGLLGVRVLEGGTIESAVERVTALTPWDCTPVGAVRGLPPPTAAELDFLRRHDPARVFLGAR
jgi:acyl CoA:acetate/3-ketoacid CoA transferase alpha subunit